MRIHTWLKIATIVASIAALDITEGEELASSPNAPPTSATNQFSDDIARLAVIKAEREPGKVEHQGQCHLRKRNGQIYLAIERADTGNSYFNVSDQIPGQLIQPDMKLGAQFKRKEMPIPIDSGNGTAIATFKDGILHVELRKMWSTGPEISTWNIHISGDSLTTTNAIEFKYINSENLNGKTISEKLSVECGQVSS